MNSITNKHQEAIKSANGWVSLLRGRAKEAHSTELASSSILSLADTLTELLQAHGELAEYCKGVGALKAERDALKRKLDEKTKPTVVKKENKEDVA